MTGGETPTLTVVGFVYFEIAVPKDAAVGMGKETFVERIDVQLGGALNTAFIAHALGARVVLAHPSGRGLTDGIAAAVLDRHGLRTRTWDANDDAAVSLVLTGGGDRALVSAADFAALGRCPELGSPGWIHVAGLHEARLLERQLGEARARGSRISVSASWAPEELDRLMTSDARWDLLFLNRIEAERSAGSVENALDRLRSIAPNVVVTRGEKGAVGVAGGERFAVTARPVEVANPTGAGDAFAAGFLAAFANGTGPARAAELGAEVAARRLTARSDQLLDPARYADLRLDA